MNRSDIKREWFVGNERLVDNEAEEYVKRLNMKYLEIYNQSLLTLEESVHRYKDTPVNDKDDYQPYVTTVMTIGKELPTV